MFENQLLALSSVIAVPSTGEKVSLSLSLYGGVIPGYVCDVDFFLFKMLWFFMRVA